MDETPSVADIMKALGNPVRMQMLSILRSPRTLGEIEVAPMRQDEAGSPGRSMSRVSVRQHLEQLIAIGAVKQVAGVRDGRSVALYQVNHRQLFALTEELRELGRLRPDQDLIADGTAAGPASPPPARHGARLVLMNGAFEGKTFPLGNGAQVWTIGRARTATVCLDYDPYLSLQNSELRFARGTFTLHDVPGNRNGTRLNWEELPKGGSRALASGDVIGVGRSQLLFRAD